MIISAIGLAIAGHKANAAAEPVGVAFYGGFETGCHRATTLARPGSGL